MELKDLKSLLTEREINIPLTQEETHALLLESYSAISLEYKDNFELIWKASSSRILEKHPSLTFFVIYVVLNTEPIYSKLKNLYTGVDFGRDLYKLILAAHYAYEYVYTYMDIPSIPVVLSLVEKVGIDITFLISAINEISNSYKEIDSDILSHPKVLEPTKSIHIFNDIFVTKFLDGGLIILEALKSPPQEI